MQIIAILIRLAGTVAVASAALMTWQAFYSPATVIRWLDQLDAGQAGQRPEQAILWLNFFGFGMIVAGGMENALAWMPADWGSVGEDGFVSLRTGLAYVTGVMAAYPMFSVIQRLAVLQNRSLPAGTGE